MSLGIEYFPSTCRNWGSTPSNTHTSNQTKREKICLKPSQEDTVKLRLHGGHWILSSPLFLSLPTRVTQETCRSGKGLTHNEPLVLMPRRSVIFISILGNM